MEVFEFEVHRTTFDRFVNAFLRIGPPFVVDSILYGSIQSKIFQYFNGFHVSSWLVSVAATFACFSLSVVLFLLSVQQLKLIHLYTTSCLLIFSAILLNVYPKPIHIYLESESTVKNLIMTVSITLTQYIALKLALFLRGRMSTDGHLTFISWIIQEQFLCACILVPPLLGFNSYLIFLLMSSIVVTVIILESYVFLCLFTLQNYIGNTRRWLEDFGLQSFCTYHWYRIDVANVMRLFWAVRFSHSVWTYWTLTEEDLVPYSMNTNEPTVQWPLVIKYLLMCSSDTTVALLGLSCVISLVMDNLGNILALLIGTNNNDQIMGSVSGLLFFILGLQTGLTSLLPRLRIVRLYRNFYMLLAAMLHYVHSMVDAALNAISVSRVSAKRHVQALLAWVCLTTFPVWITIHLWHKHRVSTWLLAVTAFSLELIIKCFVSLTIYAFFMIDSRRQTFWEELDDYIYYIKSFGNTVEFVFAIFIFANGMWIMIFESGGAVRAVMILIHTYLNIWLQAKQGWKSFTNRRLAVTKINTMPRATDEQISSHNDVCPICFSDLHNAVIAKCNHYFHSVCLRKWLYLQDACPVCRNPVSD